MSLKFEEGAGKPNVICEESMIKWADDVSFGLEELDSISSEEESGSECDGQQRVRAKPVQEIWEDEFVWDKLMALPSAEEISNLINADELDIKTITDKKDVFSTSMLLSAWLGKDLIVQELIKSGASAQYADEEGRTCLHLAASSGNVECVKILLEAGANIQAWDKHKKATALHCAASKGHLLVLRFLIRCGADVNAGLTSKSPLHCAVQSLATDCVKELLENNATPHTPQVYSETPLHVAAALGADCIIKLLLKHGAAVNIQCGSEKLTPLHLAAEDGSAECAKLLIEAGAKLSATNYKNQTPLHLAALSQCTETLELLLSKGANPNVGDSDGRTPLHGAIVKVSRSCECVKLLLNSGAHVNKPDAFGYTPLHLAALNEFSHCVMLLINYGGDVTLRTNGGVSVLTFITRKTPDVIPKYIAKFDNSIKLNDHELGDVDCELKLDFRVLVPTRGNKETELLLNFIEVGHRELLNHPLCETFMFLKWRRIRKFFLFSFIYHTLFVLLFTFYIQEVYLEKTITEVNNTITTVGYILVFLNSLLLVKEIYQIAQGWSTYAKLWENWLQWLIVISVFCCVHPTSSMNIIHDGYGWQHHVAAIGIFLAWVELMMVVGRFPIFGLYIQMFTTVTYNFTKFVMSYFCLLIAFALSFGVIFSDYKSFKDSKWTILKVIVMMSGELEFEDIFYADDYDITFPWTAHLMFLSFVVLVAIVLTNLMVGLAVSDIQGLQQSAGLDRLVRQAELVAHLEGMLFSRLLTWVPHKLMNFLHKQALLLKSQYHWALYIKPNDPREGRIPKDIIKNIYQLVAERRERPRSRNKRRPKHYRQDSDLTNTPPLSRLNSCSGTYLTGQKSHVNLKNQLDELNNDFAKFSQMFRYKTECLIKHINNQQK